ncbi:hypothetical protein [Tenacibaculum caenipelagi]|uniref:Uncharacterized protein n=1 Tax=Tenacibaculum caenipelagi TaxID=1325435 RepID=A0A4R6TEG9_9FLAO|nr:hypothetical protein [Tenacibaculum caenipelagi]TDQ25442.1 hypothetical protein DFQ07_1863 [Tenacibaculum caenipelagi]
MGKEENKKEINWFVRIALILLAGLIFTMVIFKFFYNEPISDISAGLIILIAFLLILALSESFDNFSIGKVISLSREIKKKEEKITKVETEKKELLNQLISLTNNVSQRQSNTNIYGLPSDFSKHFGVHKASEEEKEENEKEIDEIQTNVTARKRLDYRKIEEYALDRYVEENDVDISKMFKEVKLKEFDGIDPISDSSPIYDGYIKEVDKEIFLEIRPGNFISPMFTDRLYKMLSKIHHYRQLRKTNAILILVIVEIPNEQNERHIRYLNRIWEDFSPALNTGLLKIKRMKIDEKQADKFYI